MQTTDGIEPVVFGACDIKYFKEHGISFCKSVSQSGMKVCVYITPLLRGGDFKTQIEDLNIFIKNEFMKIDEETRKNILFPRLLTSYYDIDVREERAYYASIRFLLLPELLKEFEHPILVLDMDSIVNKKITFPKDTDISFYLREETNGANEYENQGMKVLAGAVYVTPAAFDFTIDVANEIKTNPVKWFCDQLAIHKAFKKNKNLKFFDMSDQNILDWEFNEDSFIWSAKGNRKYENKKYLARKMEIEKS